MKHFFSSLPTQKIHQILQGWAKCSVLLGGIVYREIVLTFKKIFIEEKGVQIFDFM